MEGRYEILHKIAEGGMGSIYKVRHRLLDAIRVAKVLHPQLAAKDEWQHRFLSEARVASRLSHRAIAQLHDFDLDADGDAWMIMEFIEGYDLDTVLKSSGPPSVALGAEIVHQVLEALAYIHQQQLIHRDISPDNLMLTRGPGRGPEIKLIDLGIAKRLGDAGSSTVVGTFLGKYQYSSPEQLESASTVDQRSDLYSLGLVLYELLTGTYAYNAETAQELAAAHWFQPPRPFSETDPESRIPSDLGIVVLKSLEKDPQDRFATAMEFRNALAKFAEPEAATGEEFDAIFAACDSGETPSADETSIASTQNRLDRVFGGKQSLGSVQEEPEARSNASQAWSLFAVATGEMAVGDWESAATNLNRAARLDPEKAEIQEALAEADSQAARQAQVRVAAEKIATLLAANQLGEAARRLESASRSLGDAKKLKELQARLDERLRERSSRVDDLLGRATRLREAGRFKSGLTAVSEALDLEPGHKAARTMKLEMGRELERQQELAKAIAAVDEQLAAEELDKADRLLRQIDETFGAQAEIVALRERMETRRTAVARELMAAARRSIAHQEWNEARTAVRRVLHFDAGHEEAQTLLRQAEKAARRQTSARQVVETVDSLLIVGKLDAAMSFLEEHRTDVGEHRQVVQVEERMQAAFHKRDRAIDALLKQADRRAESGRLEEALDVLRQAQELDRARSELRHRRSELETQLARRREIDSVAVTVRELVESGDLENAASTLAAAETQHGADDVLSKLRTGIGRRQDEAREERVADILTAAQVRIAAKDWQAAAAELRKALGLAADNRTARQQLQEVEAEIERNSRRAQAAAEIEDLLRQGRVEDARGRLDETTALLGSSSQLDALSEKATRAGEHRDLVDSHLTRAEELKNEGQYRESILEVVEAQKVDRSLDVAELLAELRQLESQARRTEKKVRQAEKMTDRGDFDAAQNILTELQAELGDEAPLRSAWQRLTDARRAARQVRIGELVESADRWRQSGNLKRALSEISTAVELDASNEQTQALLHEIESELDLRLQSRNEITQQLELLELGIDDQGLRAKEPPQRHPPREWPRSLLIAGAALLISGAIAGLGWHFLWWSGAVMVAPDPAVPGATIWIDGQDSGQLTPTDVQLRGRKGAAVEITLKDGVRTLTSRRFVLGPEAESQWAPRIPVQRRIASQPAGARVAVDGDWLEQLTPVDVELDPDPAIIHEIRLELADYEPAATQVTLASWTEAITLELQPRAAPGSLIVRAPYSVQVKLGDDTLQGRSHEIEVAAGHHQIDLSAPGLFFFRKRTVEIKAGEQVALTDFPPPVSVWVFSVPGNSKLRVDGRSVGDLPREVTMVAGRHRLDFSWPETTFTDTVEILATSKKVSSDATRIVVD